MFVELDFRKLAIEAIENSSKKEYYPEYIIDLTDEIGDYINRKYYNEAILKCHELSELTPQSNFGDLFKAMILSSQKSYFESDEIIKELEENKTSILEEELKFFILACNRFYSNDYLKSISYCDRTIKINKNNRLIYLIRGMANAQVGIYKIAIRDFKLALKEKFEVKSLKANLAYCYLRNKNNFKALFLFQQVVKFFPDNYLVNYNTGLSYNRFKLRRKAIKYLNRTEELQPNFSGTYLTRGYIYLKMGKKQDAYNDLMKAKKLGCNKNVDELVNKYFK